MDYEIDIEEHDVLDNPVIKKIFPDISVIKKEITQYFDEEPNIKEEARLRIQQLQSNVNDSNFDTLKCLQNKDTQPIQSNKIILGSKPISNTQDEKGKSNIFKLNSDATQLNFNKKIILGSKPNADVQNVKQTHTNLSTVFNSTQGDNNEKKIISNKQNKSSITSHEEKFKLKHIRLILQDIKSYLNQNGRYCKKCCRLFLSKKALDIHKNKVHHNSICKNKTLTNKKHATITPHRCNICGSYFSCSGNLYRHYKNIHQKSWKLLKKNAKASFETDETQKSHTANSSNRLICTKSNVHHIKKHKNKDLINKIHPKKSRYRCSICDSYFSNSGNVHRHYRNVHKNSLKLIKKDASRTSATGKELQLNTIQNDLVTKENPKEIATSRKKFQVTKTKVKTHVKQTSVLFAEINNCEVACVNKKHALKYATRAKNSLSKDANTCLHCKKVFSDQKSLIEHMYDILEPKRTSGLIKSDVNDMSKKEGDKILFVCRQCSYYLPTIKSYFAHMVRNHKTEVFLEVLKEEFDAQCKYCPSKNSSIAAHNKHVYVHHIDLMFMQIKDESSNERNNHINNNEKPVKKNRELNSFALESVIFECNKCNVCFLSSNIARHHKQHMVLLRNWKCSICQNILKEQDKKLHLKQHTFSRQLKVLNLNDTATCNVLYNCTKCAIHFTEKRYQEHYPNCGSYSTDSSYCSICDILIDKIEMNQHQIQHEQLKDITDFTIIDSNIIEETTTNLKRKGTYAEPEVKLKKILYEQHNCLTYCYTCKSFLSNIRLKNKSHIKGLCSNLPTYACNVCGLVFTSSTWKVHKKRHIKEKNLRLQDFKFFDLKGKQVCPPIPEYPHCEICKIHFLRKNGIARHICAKSDFLECNICDKKLSVKTFKLHNSFHNYSIIHRTPLHNAPNQLLGSHDENLTSETPNKLIKYDSDINCTSVISKTTRDSKSKTNLNVKATFTAEEKSHHKPELLEAKNIIPLITSDENNGVTKEEKNRANLIESPNGNVMSNYEFSVVLYTCKTCGITVESYDEVISHCLIHYGASKKTISQITRKKCRQCSLNFDSDLYLNHQRNVHSGVSKIHVLKFDPSYFPSKNMIWIKHLFQTLPNEMIKKLLKNSIYQHEHRIQFECIQNGSSSLYVYKCNMCGNFIDPGYIYKHAEKPCGKVRKHPCSFCGLPFISSFSRSSHEKLHTEAKCFTKISLNIILFNQRKDKTFNNRIFYTTNQYLLYQCRNCDRVAEKSTLTNHVCDRSTLDKCIKCGLLISKEEFKAHLSKHTDLGNFYSENFKVILFGCKDGKNKDVTKSLLPCFSGTVYDYSLYKCQICEMCLKNTENYDNHTCMPNSDLDRSMCSECDLYFTSNYLKIHIKQHKTDPDFKKENINVILFNDNLRQTINYKNNKTKKTIKNKNDKEKTDKSNVKELISINDSDREVNVSVELYQNDNNEKGVDDDKKIKCKVNDNIDDDQKNCIADAKKSLNNDKDDSGDDRIEINIDEVLETLYKCKCGLHFLSKPKVMEHFFKCQPKSKQSKQSCSKCHLLFNATELFSHLIVHHRDKTHVQTFKVIEIHKDSM